MPGYCYVEGFSAASALVACVADSLNRRYSIGDLITRPAAAQATALVAKLVYGFGNVSIVFYLYIYILMRKV